mmetsp:Transcript_1969/g.4631  ORF Transcript_1969/g.4631 Transcript_1969/m.4631 type:complete len:220 (-) Transcript_1969:270-929(-)
MQIHFHSRSSADCLQQVQLVKLSQRVAPLRKTEFTLDLINLAGNNLWVVLCKSLPPQRLEVKGAVVLLSIPMTRAECVTTAAGETSVANPFVALETPVVILLLRRFILTDRGDWYRRRLDFRSLCVKRLRYGLGRLRKVIWVLNGRLQLGWGHVCCHFVGHSLCSRISLRTGLAVTVAFAAQVRASRIREESTSICTKTWLSRRLNTFLLLTMVRIHDS